jgi:hypothetical protein
MLDVDRSDLTSFLSGSSDYAPASGAITGILKQMGALTDATSLQPASEGVGNLQTLS